MNAFGCSRYWQLFAQHSSTQFAGIGVPASPAFLIFALWRFLAGLVQIWRGGRAADRRQILSLIRSRLILAAP
jgi:hypothetical protein